MKKASFHHFGPQIARIGFEWLFVAGLEFFRLNAFLDVFHFVSYAMVHRRMILSL